MDGPRSTEPWRGAVNAILYTLLFAEPDDAKAVQLAGLIRSERVLTGGVDRYRDALRDALAQDGPVGDGLPTPHGEPELRAFLRTLQHLLGAGPARLDQP